MKLKKRIFLVGFMGCGKTTVGKLLAKKSGLPFYDVDKEIEKKVNKSIKEIFEEFGEEYFRKLETEEIKRLCAGKKAIISGGGGAYFGKNKSLIDKNCFTIYLEVDLDELKKRIKANDKRPLAHKEDKDIDMMFNERKKDYETANLTIEIKDKSPLEVVEEILSCVR